MDRYDTCAALRQKIIDCLTANPYQGINAVRDAIGGVHRETIAANMRKMAEKKELEAKGSGQAQVFRALVKRTESADSMRDSAHHKKSLTRFGIVEPEDETTDDVTVEIAPGHTRHLGTHRSKPIRHPDAMHSGRQRVHIGCSAEMV